MAQARVILGLGFSLLWFSEALQDPVKQQDLEHLPAFPSGQERWWEKEALGPFRFISMGHCPAHLSPGPLTEQELTAIPASLPGVTGTGMSLHVQQLVVPFC